MKKPMNKEKVRKMKILISILMIFLMGCAPVKSTSNSITVQLPIIYKVIELACIKGAVKLKNMKLVNPVNKLKRDELFTYCTNLHDEIITIQDLNIIGKANE